MQSDLDQWSLLFGLPKTNIIKRYPKLNTSRSAKTPPGFNAHWQQEESLDVETVHGIAPAAAIVYLGAESAGDADFFAATNYVLEKKLASLVSNSYSKWLHHMYASVNR